MTEGNCKKWGVEKEGLWGITIDGDSKVLQGMFPQDAASGTHAERTGGSILEVNIGRGVKKGLSSGRS